MGGWCIIIATKGTAGNKGYTHNFSCYLFFLNTGFPADPIFVLQIKIIKIMALEIKSPPALRGKAAIEFLERAAKFTDDTPKEKVQESFRQTKIFLAKYYNPYKDVKI